MRRCEGEKKESRRGGEKCPQTSDGGLKRPRAKVFAQNDHAFKRSKTPSQKGGKKSGKKERRESKMSENTEDLM